MKKLADIASSVANHLSGVPLGEALLKAHTGVEDLESVIAELSTLEKLDLNIAFFLDVYARKLLPDSIADEIINFVLSDKVKLKIIPVMREHLQRVCNFKIQNDSVCFKTFLDRYEEPGSVLKAIMIQNGDLNATLSQTDFNTLHFQCEKLKSTFGINGLWALWDFMHLDAEHLRQAVIYMLRLDTANVEDHSFSNHDLLGSTVNSLRLLTNSKSGQ